MMNLAGRCGAGFAGAACVGCKDWSANNEDASGRSQRVACENRGLILNCLDKHPRLGA